MKKITLLLSLAFLAFSCSDDDDSSSGTECETCEILGFETTFCDNGDGTFTQSIEGGEDVTQDLPDGITFEEFTETTCSEGDLDLEGLLEGLEDLDFAGE